MSNCIFIIVVTTLSVLTSFGTLFCQWIQQPVSINEHLAKIRFVDDTTGWILGRENHLYKTTDGGLIWVPQDTLLGYGFSLYALNTDVAFYSSYTFEQPYTRGIRRTIDEGTTWETVDSSLYYYNEFEFVDAQIGYAAGADSNWSPVLRKTTDGGKTWVTIADNFNPSKYDITGISFIDATHGWAVSYDACIFNTIDGGLSWSLQDSVRTNYQALLPLRDIEFVTPDSGWAVGGISGSMLIVSTTDGGEHWNYDVGTGSSLREVTFLDNQTGWAVGTALGPYIVRTANGGKNWDWQSFDPPHDPTITGVKSISMLNQNLGWAIGDFPGQIFKTTNGGVLVSVDTNTNSKYHIPEQLSLKQNYPNPFNAETKIEFSIAHSGKVQLTIYNTKGEVIRTLVNEKKPFGDHFVIWDGLNEKGHVVASGLYFYVLKNDKSTATSKRMIMLK